MTGQPQDRDENGDGFDYELVMPFTVVASRGGPHDDAAFVAGFRLGQVYAALELTDVWEGTVRDEDLPQLDLIAMKHNLSMTAVEMGDGWVYASIEPTRGGGDG